MHTNSHTHNSSHMYIHKLTHRSSQMSTHKLTHTDCQMYAHSHIQAGPVRPVAECATRIRSGQWWGSEGQCADSHGGRERGRTWAISCVLLCVSACVCVCMCVPPEYVVVSGGDVKGSVLTVMEEGSEVGRVPLHVCSCA